MHPTYLAELGELEGQGFTESPPVPEGGVLLPGLFVRPFLPVGTPVVLAQAGALTGQIGRVFKRGRTHYKVLTANGVVSVLAMAVRPRQGADRLGESQVIPSDVAGDAEPAP